MQNLSFSPTNHWRLNSRLVRGLVLVFFTSTIGFLTESHGTPEKHGGPAANQSTDTLDSVRASEQKLLYAKKIVAAYQALLQNPDISQKDKKEANRRISQLSKEAARESIMIGKQFYLADEINRFQSETNKEIDDFLIAVLQKDKLEITKFFKTASKKDPVSCRADFILGISYALASRNYDLAFDQFQECEKRLTNFGTFASRNTEQSLQAVYNNLALVQIRRGFLDSALKYWVLAAETGPSIPDPILGNFLHQSTFLDAAVRSKGQYYFLDPKTTTLTKYTKFTERYLNGVKGNLSQHGWQYLNLQMEPKDPDAELLKISLVDATCLNCNGTGIKRCTKCNGDGVFLIRVYKDSLFSGTNVLVPCQDCENGKVPCRDSSGNPLCDKGIEKTK